MSENLPSTKLFGDYNADEDFKDMRQQDKILPRMSLLQFASPAVKSRRGQAGDWFDLSTEKVITPFEQKIGIIPITWWIEWIAWNPNRDAPKNEKILSRSLDPSGELARLADSRVKIKNSEGKDMFKSTEVYNFLVLAPDYTNNYTDPLLLSCSRTAHFPAKQWLNRLRSFAVRNQRGEFEKVPLCFGMWELTSKMEAGKAKNQDYMVPVFGNGSLVAQDVWPHLGELAKQIKEFKQTLIARAAETLHEVEGGEAEAPPVRNDI